MGRVVHPSTHYFGERVITALPEMAGLVVCLAVTVMVRVDFMDFGAVYIPEAEIVPICGLRDQTVPVALA